MDIQQQQQQQHSYGKKRIEERLLFIWNRNFGCNRDARQQSVQNKEKDKQKVKRNTRHSQQITEAENTGRRIPLRIQLFSLIICFLFCQSHFLPSLPNATPVVATVVPPSGAGGQKVEKRSNVCGFISCFSAAVYVFFLFILPTEKKTE
jgi:hypothetical protein